MCRSILLFMFLFTLPASATSKTINWVVVDFAPYYILSDQFIGTGRDESVISLLEQELPSYTFNRVIFPSSRALLEVSNPNKTYCMLSL